MQMLFKLMFAVLIAALVLVVTLPAEAESPPLPRERPKPAPEVVETVDKPAEAEAEAEAEARVYQTACPALLGGLIIGEMLPPIAEGQCGERSPISVTGVLVNGRMVELSSEVTLSCAMASALSGWLSQVDGYAFARDNARLSGISVGTSYMCRDRVGGGTEFVSEHGFANGLDVVGFSLDDGRAITVLDGWPGKKEDGSEIVRAAHDAACSSFSTTLGPEANEDHRDHLHVDMGCHGKTCTARLCE